MEDIISLAIPFIAVAIAATIVDVIMSNLEEAMGRIPLMPDYLSLPAAYSVVLALSYYFCWQGDFNLFSYLDVSFNYDWQGWLMTAFVISGGSKFVREKYSLIGKIPSGIYGLRKNVSQAIKGDPVKEDDKDNRPTI